LKQFLLVLCALAVILTGCSVKQDMKVKTVEQTDNNMEPTITNTEPTETVSEDNTATDEGVNMNVADLSEFKDQTQKGVALMKGMPMEKLYVFKGSSFTSDAEKVLVASLQGLVSKSSGNKIYIDEGGPSTVWKNYLTSEYGFPVEKEYTNAKALLADFKDYVRGYILIDMAGNANSINVASSINGYNYAIIVDKSMETLAKDAGLSMIMDVSDKDEAWAFDNVKQYSSSDYAAELSPSVFYHLRDYISMTNQFTFYGDINNWRRNVLKSLNPNATLFGYGKEEFDMINMASQQGVTSIPSDMAPNLSVLSSIYPVTPILQKAHSEKKEVEKKHYVTFVISDGDNVAFDLWTLQNYFNDPARGKFDVGYGISPSIYDLAPSVLQWYYENANTGEVKDQFIAGPSGTGYTFPSKMSSEELDSYVARQNEYMEKADLGITEVLDQGAVNDMPVWSKFLNQPNIDAIFYFGYGETTQGEINWQGDKPVIAQSNVLWEGLTEEDELIKFLNDAKVDPTSNEGYSLILVHCWTKSLSDVATVVNGLNDNVEVVAPEEFVQLIKDNVKH